SPASGHPRRCVRCSPPPVRQPPTPSAEAAHSRVDQPALTGGPHTDRVTRRVSACLTSSGRRARHVDVTLAKGKHFADTGRRPEHHLDDLLQLPIGRWTREALTSVPAAYRRPDCFDLGCGECRGLRGRLAQPCGLTHRILRNRVVAHGKAKREAQDGPRLFGHAVALVDCQPLEETINLTDGDLP